MAIASKLVRLFEVFVDEIGDDDDDEDVDVGKIKELDDASVLGDVCCCCLPLLFKLIEFGECILALLLV